jgi:hypothetical protein
MPVATGKFLLDQYLLKSSQTFVNNIHKQQLKHKTDQKKAVQ